MALGFDGLFLLHDGEAASGSPESVGFKAFNLQRMARLGVAVPPGFVIGTGWCGRLSIPGTGGDGQLPRMVEAGLAQLEATSGLAFGHARRPLLVSVRSGAARSMPGMMDTVLNVGLCDATVRGLMRLHGNPRLAWDSYRRLVQGFGEVVEHIPTAVFDAALRAEADLVGAASAGELDFRALRGVTQRFLEAFEEASGRPFPQSPTVQLEQAVRAVFRSWWSDRARFYRAANAIPDAPGTAVTVQQMVYGNGGGFSGAGVGFTRDPATGDARLYLDFASCSQGEDVVAGRSLVSDRHEFERRMPEAHAAVYATASLLEREFRDAQEFEFTIQDGHPFFLQTRSAKRTPLAALRIAADMLDEGLITVAEAWDRVRDVDPASLEELRVVEPAGAIPVASAVSASVGVAAGRAVFDPARAVALAADGQPVILVREDLSTSDIAALQCSAGVLTARGSRTSHAAVVARQLGKVCLVACERLVIQPSGNRATLGDRVVQEGDVLCLDSATGTVYAGQPRLARSTPEALIERREAWRNAESDSAGVTVTETRPMGADAPSGRRPLPVEFP